MTTYTNAWIVTMDDAGTEHERGWLRVEDGLVAEVDAGDAEGEDLRGAVVTPGLVNTHHHLYQTLTRARAQQATLFEWLRELYPVWAGIDEEAEYAAARTGLAELALSGCATVFDHHYVFPRGGWASACTPISPRPSRRRSTAASSTAAGRSSTWSGSAGSPRTCGARTASTSTTATSRPSPPRAPASRTAP